jgi:hypothetical protein
MLRLTTKTWWWVHPHPPTLDHELDSIFAPVGDGQLSVNHGLLTQIPTPLPSVLPLLVKSL